ncbi:carbohydrate ABC transporter permease [Paenibacillus thermotolerans]|uniref:carbohydrate ABC transporter permease n=1 Tax=Paenibacillus thermotolerans TaxID=3027807 RepID=UPI002367E02F|nr:MULTISPECIES: carbohydrate ABC transporter permease [unclassified Paenibacillus]
MYYKSTSRTIFNILNYTLFILFSISILVPFLNAIAISLSSFEAVQRGKIGIWPDGFNIESYKSLAANYTFVRSFVNTVCLTIINTAKVIICSLAAAYALSHKRLFGKSVVFYYILIPMFFGGGLIPFYLLVNGLGLNNTYWALILPGFVNIFYIIVFKNVIDQLPKELLESAEMDGAGETRILFRIVLPLVLPMTTAFTIFSAVGYWNEWFGVLLFIRDHNMWTLQFQLRDLLINAALTNDPNHSTLAKDAILVHPENLKMAALMITILPIIVIYPFLQKYFIHGQMVGAVKG